MREMPFDLTLKGLRIPFVAAWELEPPLIGWDGTVMHDAVFSGVVDHRADAISGRLGKVILGEMAPQRQRYVMVHGLCQVCGLKMTTPVVLGHVASHGPEQLLAIDEPPCCPSCALVAVELCPYARAQWARGGGYLLAEKTLHIQLAGLKKGDDRSKFVRNGGPPLPRATFRRYLDKPLAFHVRMVPNCWAHIEGEKGLRVLRELAEAGQRIGCKL